MLDLFIAPMAEAAALHGQEVSQETIDKIRAMAASADNIGNFFAKIFLLRQEEYY